MRDLSYLNDKRIRHPWAGMGDATNGMFQIRIGTQPFTVIASDGGGWDHVSVSHKKRTPTWEEMCQVKAMFFEPEDIVVQFHPKQSEYVNVHPFCLHLWRLQFGHFPRPARLLV